MRNLSSKDTRTTRYFGWRPQQKKTQKNCSRWNPHLNWQTKRSSTSSRTLPGMSWISNYRKHRRYASAGYQRKKHLRNFTFRCVRFFRAPIPWSVVRKKFSSFFYGASAHSSQNWSFLRRRPATDDDVLWMKERGALLDQQVSARSPPRYWGKTFPVSITSFVRLEKKLNQTLLLEAVVKCLRHWKQTHIRNDILFRQNKTKNWVNFTQIYRQISHFCKRNREQCSWPQESRTYMTYDIWQLSKARNLRTQKSIEQ